MDPSQAVTELQTTSIAVADSIARPRFFALFLGALTLITVVLTALGLYGVLSYLVRNRTPELGIRMALGADRREVIGVALGEGLAPVAVGTVLGLFVAFVGARATRSLLFGVEPWSPSVFIAAVGILGVVAALASWLPARRAASLDPLHALRAE